MADQSKIEWTDSTFNPWIGCTRISPACDHCYAATQMDTRLGLVHWGKHQARVRTSTANWQKPMQWNARPFKECLGCGLRGEFDHCAGCGLDAQKARRRVFCSSLADVFDNEVDPGWRQDLFDLIANTPNLDWLLLTKRVGNASAMINAALLEDGARWPWPNVWIGATVCNQAEADRDIPKLLAMPAAVRFLSIEPMLGSIDLTNLARPSGPGEHHFDCLDCDVDSEDDEWGGATVSWVIAGGESGPHARPSHPDWFRSLRDQCAAANVPFLFKQWGEWVPRGPESLGYPSVEGVSRVRLTDTGADSSDMSATGDNDCWMNRAGKRAAGRSLDGMQHDGYPMSVAP